MAAPAGEATTIVAGCTLSVTSVRLMQRRTRPREIARYAYGPDDAEAFIILAIATILITRLYLKLTGYPQVVAVICTSRTLCMAVR